MIMHQNCHIRAHKNKWDRKTLIRRLVIAFKNSGQKVEHRLKWCLTGKSFYSAESKSNVIKKITSVKLNSSSV